MVRPSLDLKSRNYTGMINILQNVIRKSFRVGVFGWSSPAKISEHTRKEKFRDGQYQLPCPLSTGCEEEDVEEEEKKVPLNLLETRLVVGLGACICIRHQTIFLVFELIWV